MINRNSQLATCNSSRPRGFTLLEVLVTLGIILVLIGVAVPVVSKVRRQAQAANTRQTLARIEAGLQQYYEEFRAYPGAFFSQQHRPFTTGAPRIDYPTNSGAALDLGTAVTSTEAMYLALAGGLQVVPGGAFVANESMYRNANGPLSLNVANIKKYPAYISITPDETTYKVLNPAAAAATAGQWNGGSGAFTGDTIVPEIVDKFASPKPILYMRATRGAPGFINNGTTYDATVQYNVAEITHTYSNSHVVGGVSEYAKVWSASAEDFPGGMDGYFRNPASTTLAPYQKDGFILISAGPDGKYGTRDDITNFRNQ